jgi:hypothetical protein
MIHTKKVLGTSIPQSVYWNNALKKFRRMKMEWLKGFGILTVAAIVIGLLILGPLATIWAVNTLFPTLAIPYSFETWVSVVILGMFLKGNVTVKK